MVLLRTHELTAYISIICTSKAKFIWITITCTRLRGGLCETDILHASKPPPPPPVQWAILTDLHFLLYRAICWKLIINTSLHAQRYTYTTVYVLIMTWWFMTEHIYSRGGIQEPFEQMGGKQPNRKWSCNYLINVSIHVDFLWLQAKLCVRLQAEFVRSTSYFSSEHHSIIGCTSLFRVDLCALLLIPHAIIIYFLQLSIIIQHCVPHCW